MVEKNEILSRIEQLMKDRNWSLYRLSSESEIPYNTLRNLYVRNNDPTLETIRKICKCFNISLQDFFADTLVLNDTVSYYTSMENKILSALWSEQTEKIYIIRKNAIGFQFNPVAFFF